MSEQKRQLPRYRFDDLVDVFDRERQLWLGRLVNLHEAGLMITGSQAIKEDGLYPLELRLSQSLEQGRDRILLDADCLWTRAADQDDQHWSGFAVVNVSAQASADLKALIDRWGEGGFE